MNLALPFVGNLIPVVVQARTQQFVHLSALANAECKRLSTEDNERPWVLFYGNLTASTVASLISNAPDLLDSLRHTDSSSTLIHSVVAPRLGKTGRLGIAVSINEAVNIQVALYTAFQEAVGADAQNMVGSKYHIWPIQSPHRDSQQKLYLSLKFERTKLNHTYSDSAVANLFVCSSDTLLSPESSQAADSSKWEEWSRVMSRQSTALGTVTTNLSAQGTDSHTALEYAKQIRHHLLENVARRMEEDF